SKRRNTKLSRDWSSDVCFSDLVKISELPSPLMSLLVKDINGDGNPDILTGGNSEVARVSTGPSTANYGMVFLGDGHGDFTLFDRSEERRVGNLNICMLAMTDTN